MLIWVSPDRLPMHRRKQYLLCVFAIAAMALETKAEGRQLMRLSVRQR